MYVPVEVIVGASCAIGVWIIVILYFFVRPRPRPSQEHVIIDIINKALFDEFEAEKRLRKTFAKSKGSNPALFIGGDIQRTQVMMGRWLVDKYNNWDEENFPK